MTRHRFYVGTQTKRGNPVLPETWQEIEHNLTRIFAGFTRYDGIGAWQDDVGQVISERCRIYEILTETHGDHAATAQWIRDMANQSAVLYTHEEVHGQFV